MWYQLQHISVQQGDALCCDLLKKLYLCGINYNTSQNKPLQPAVVICLKSCIFVVSITTDYVSKNRFYRCDLLKKLYLCGINYNNCLNIEGIDWVVICLKSCIFVVSITTHLRRDVRRPRL